ncbi:MFS transporter [Actinoplanes sp. CA-131856]
MTVDGNADAPVVDASIWAPLRRRAFRWLWLGMMVSTVGTWMQTVGAQWLLVDAPNAAVLVSLVQAASTLPVMLLALPGGVLADSFDRRWLLLTVQAYFLVVASLLVVLTVLGEMPSSLLLALTFALGAGVAVQHPGWQSLIPELLPRTQLRAAARLHMVSVNLARSVGPALAGLVIARLSVPFVFAMNAASVGFFALVLVLWRRPLGGSLERERFLPALRAGGRYVWNEPVVRRVMLRSALFITPAMALWALLPLIAGRRLGLGADGFGALFGALGGGAVLGAVLLGRVRAHLTANGMLAAAGTLYAVALALIVVAPGFLAALATLVLAGMAWMAVMSTLNAELQLFLPAWVRARGLGLYLVVITGSQAFGALLWGLVADRAGLEAALLIAAMAAVAGVLAGLMWPIPETEHLDLQPVVWPEARLAFEPEPQAGPVMVAVEYTVRAEREASFLEAMTPLRRSRLRTGASRWGLYRDGARPDRFVELFSVPSWDEHLRQHGGRITAEDRALEKAVYALSDPPPRADHLLPP